MPVLYEDWSVLLQPGQYEVLMRDNLLLRSLQKMGVEKFDGYSAAKAYTDFRMKLWEEK